jgi:hypothetical protein
MAKNPATPATPAPRVNQPKYHCRCYKVGDVYEMWVLDPSSGTYNGPVPCTEAQCRKCNMSEAEIV